MSEVTNEHILHELRGLRADVVKLTSTLELLITAVSNHADQLFDHEDRLDKLERIYGAPNGAAEPTGE